MWPNPQVPADLVAFTEEILNGKLRFVCSVISYISLGSCIIHHTVLYIPLKGLHYRISYTIQSAENFFS